MAAIFRYLWQLLNLVMMDDIEINWWILYWIWTIITLACKLAIIESELPADPTGGELPRDGTGDGTCSLVEGDGDRDESDRFELDCSRKKP